MTVYSKDNLIEYHLLISTICTVQKGRLTLTPTCIFDGVLILDPIFTFDLFIYSFIVSTQVFNYGNYLKCPSLLVMNHK